MVIINVYLIYMNKMFKNFFTHNLLHVIFSYITKNLPNGKDDNLALDGIINNVDQSCVPWGF